MEIERPTTSVPGQALASDDARSSAEANPSLEAPSIDLSLAEPPPRSEIHAETPSSGAGLEERAATLPPPPPPEQPPLTQFTCFEKLCPELQTKIWQMAFPTRRFVAIQLQSIERKYFDGSNLPQMYGVLSTPTPAPTLAAGADEETRIEFERQRGGTCFAPALFGTRASMGLPGCIQFNYATDVAFFSRAPAPKKSNPLDFLSGHDLRRIEQLAVELDGPFFRRLVWMLPEFPRLKRFFLVINKVNELIDLSKCKGLVSKTTFDLPAYKSFCRNNIRDGGENADSKLQALPVEVRKEIKHRISIEYGVEAIRGSRVAFPVSPEKQLTWSAPREIFTRGLPKQLDVPFDIIVLEYQR